MKSLIVFGMLILLSGISFAQDRTWQTYTTKNISWSILAPGVMRPDEEAMKAGSSQGSYSYNDFNGFFAVIYKDYGGLKLFPWKKGHLTKQRDLVLKANKGKVIKDEEIRIGDITGREVQIRMPDNRVIGRESNVKPQHRVQRFRMFFKGNRFYNILAVVPEEQVNSAEITNFLTSFTFK